METKNSHVSGCDGQLVDNVKEWFCYSGKRKERISWYT